MTDKEIKKAFDTMKRSLAKEIGIRSGYYCNARQIENRTATLLVCSCTPYEKEIERAKAIDKTVQGYTTWTDEEKAASHNRFLEDIARFQGKMERYKTKGCEFLAVKRAVSESKAYNAFAANFGKVTMDSEIANNCYYIRFHY